MNKENQIEEMASDIAQSGMLDCRSRCRIVAEELYCKGYRKQREAEWISVDERMPLNFESVLVLATSRLEDDGYDVLIAYHDRGEWEERCVHGDGNTVYAHVKYWMPLPEPPKGDRHEM